MTTNNETNTRKVEEIARDMEVAIREAVGKIKIKIHREDIDKIDFLEKVNSLNHEYYLVTGKNYGSEEHELMAALEQRIEQFSEMCRKERRRMEITHCGREEFFKRISKISDENLQNFYVRGDVIIRPDKKTNWYELVTSCYGNSSDDDWEGGEKVKVAIVKAVEIMEMLENGQLEQTIIKARKALDVQIRLLADTFIESFSKQKSAQKYQELVQQSKEKPEVKKEDAGNIHQATL